MRLTLRGRVDRDFFTPIVRWITSVRTFLGHSGVHRMASANFNVRGWQGRQASYSADGLVFFGGAILGWTRRLPEAINIAPGLRPLFELPKHPDEGNA
jgi:hypothetical protein